MKKTKILAIIIFLAVVATGVYVLILDRNAMEQRDTMLQSRFSQNEQDFNDSGQAKAILDETDLWKFHQDDNAGFSIKYPSNVNFQGEGAGGYTLTVEVQKIEDLNGTMGFDTETAQKNKEALQIGEYGQNVDWPLEASKMSVTLGPVNAQHFIVLSRFEVCDVVFEKDIPCTKLFRF